MASHDSNPTPPTPDDDARLWARVAGGLDSAPLDDLELAAWLDETLDEGARDAVENRLADDSAARAAADDVRGIDFEAARRTLVSPAILTAARDLVPGGRSRRQPTIVVTAIRWTVAAAAMIAVCVTGYRAGFSTPDSPQLTSDNVLAEASFGLLTDADFEDDFTYELLLASLSEDQT